MDARCAFRDGFRKPRLRAVLSDVPLVAPREFTVEMVCALGVVALALMDRDETGVKEVLVLSPALALRRRVSCIQSAFFATHTAGTGPGSCSTRQLEKEVTPLTSQPSSTNQFSTAWLEVWPNQ